MLKGAFRMLSKLKQKHQEGGFTIIEVMIVLAIAGLIMVVVFLAVPALQRSSRNQARKADVTNMLGAVGEYVSNNAGTLPASAAFSTAFANTATLSYYTTAANVQWNNSAAARTGAVPTNTNLDSVTVYNYLKCSGNNATFANATARSYAALYAVEGGAGGAAVQQCLEG